MYRRVEMYEKMANRWPKIMKILSTIWEQSDEHALPKKHCSACKGTGLKTDPNNVENERINHEDLYKEDRRLEVGRGPLRV